MAALSLLMLIGWVMLASLQSQRGSALHEQVLNSAQLQARTLQENLSEQAYRPGAFTAMTSQPLTAVPSHPDLCYRMDVVHLSSTLARADVGVYWAIPGSPVRIDTGKPQRGLIVKLTRWLAP